MTHTPYSHLSDDELLSHVYAKTNVSDIELELAHRLEHTLDCNVRGVHQNNGARTTSPELEEVLNSIERVAQVQLELE